MPGMKESKLVGKRQLRRNVAKALLAAENAVPYNHWPQIQSSHSQSFPPCEISNYEAFSLPCQPSSSKISRCEEFISTHISIQSLQADPFLQQAEPAGLSDLKNAEEYVLPKILTTDSIRAWSHKNNITLSALRGLLMILSPFHENLPKDARTVMGTPRETPVTKLDNGDYFHLGLVESLTARVIKGGVRPGTENISVIFNIDGIPLFKSKGIDCWPILGQSLDLIDCRPFVIGLYCGEGKPKTLTDYLSNFINDIQNATASGIHDASGKRYGFEIRAFVCDAPARSYLKCIKSHTGYFGCEKCTQEGEWVNNRLTYPDRNAPLRLDHSYDESHNLPEKSPLAKLQLGLVSQFPLDPMHLIYLGVTKRILLQLIVGKPPAKLKSLDISRITARLVDMAKFIPNDFARRTRSLKEVKRWKATEFRLFLLYAGPVVLKGILHPSLYSHFLMLHCAVLIMSNDKLLKVYLDFASLLLDNFVRLCEGFYGKTMLVYNVHNLIHLPNDVRKFGNLNMFSAFDFENYLGILKRKLRSPTAPVQQLARRIIESESLTYEPIADDFKYKLMYPHSEGPSVDSCAHFQRYKKLVFQNFAYQLNPQTILCS